MAYTTSQLIERAKDIRQTEYKVSGEGIIMPNYISGPKYNKWLNDIKIKADNLPDTCPLKKEFNNTYFFKNSHASTFDKMIGLLESLEEWESDQNVISDSVAIRRVQMKEYDVFLSHANADKNGYVDELYNILSKLGIRIFYDKESLEWGDDWKKRILDGTQKSEFAIIVISENFFGREWTEKELSEFLNRQNQDGQKIILPLLYNISIDDLKFHYPNLESIQALQATGISKEEVAIQFARQLIRRLKQMG